MDVDERGAVGAMNRPEMNFGLIGESPLKRTEEVCGEIRENLGWVLKRR